MNTKIYKRLYEIESKGYKAVLGKMHDALKYKVQSQFITFVKNSMKEMAQENLFMYKRIIDKQSEYNKTKLIKDYNRNQYYKQNICKYPSIDFYKEQKKHTSSSIDRNKGVKSRCHTENNDHKMSTLNSDLRKFEKKNFNKTYEVFDNNRIRAKKRKKFKDFNCTDLKELKNKIIKNNLKNEDTKINNELKHKKEEITIYNKISENKNNELNNKESDKIQNNNKENNNKINNNKEIIENNCNLNDNFF